MWGLCRSQSVLSPLETSFSTLDEIFAYFGSPASMWRTIVLGGCGMQVWRVGMACGRGLKVWHVGVACGHGMWL